MDDTKRLRSPAARLSGADLPPWTDGSAHHLAARRRTAIIGGFVEAEEVADDAAVEEGAVGVGVGEVGGLELEGAELVEDGLGAA